MRAADVIGRAPGAAGLFASLGPSFVVGLLHSENHVLGGLVIATLAGSGAVAQLVCARLSTHRAILIGTAVLLVGVVAMSVPSVVAGFASASLGLRTTAIVFFAAVGGLALAGLAALPVVRVPRRERGREDNPVGDAPVGRGPSPCGTPCHVTCGVRVASETA